MKIEKIYVCSEESYSGFKASTSQIVRLNRTEYLRKKKFNYLYDDGTYYSCKLIWTEFIEFDEANHKHGLVLGRKPENKLDKIRLTIKQLLLQWDALYNSVKHVEYRARDVEVCKKMDALMSKIDLLRDERDKLEEEEEKRAIEDYFNNSIYDDDLPF